VNDNIPELFVLIDIVKGALLRRMEREAGMILHDSFLTPVQRAKAVTLYERVGENFVSYIISLRVIKTPGFLFTMARNAVDVFQGNLDLAWAFAYDGRCKPINWLPTWNKVEDIINES
jgi:hypothetical protein